MVAPCAGGGGGVQCGCMWLMGGGGGVYIVFPLAFVPASVLLFCFFLVELRVFLVLVDVLLPVL